MATGAVRIMNKLNFRPSAKPSEAERWICVYPTYLNSKRTRQEGRRLPLENCVENPTYVEICGVLSVTNLNYAVDCKRYPREKSRESEYTAVRVRVQLRNEDGTPCDPEFPTRESIMLYCASKIPQLKSRQNKASEVAVQQQPTTSCASQPSSSTSGGGKKGKGKRR